MTSQVIKYPSETTNITVPVNSELSDSAPDLVSISGTTLTFASTISESSGTFNVTHPVTQLGTDIDGSNINDNFGNSVSLSADGTIMVVGASYYGNNNTGQVSFYKYNSGSWSPLGSSITGDSNYLYFGCSVSLNASGTIVAIGAYGANDGAGSASGRVQVYEYTGDPLAWTQIGDNISGEYSSDYSGWSVSLNDAGTIVAIGAYKHRTGATSTGTENGRIQVYEYSSSSWSQLGSDIDGVNASENFGYDVSLNYDGTILAGGSSKNQGYVRIYQYISESWSQLGDTIEGDSFSGGSSDQAGRSISLNYDGTIVAIGAYGNNGGGTDSGTARIYKYSNVSWSQLGEDIDGESAWDQSGYNVALNNDGDIVAIGATRNDGSASNAGHVRIYKYINSAWSQIGTDIDGEEIDDESGYSVSLNADGKTVAIGAIYNDDGSSNAGHVRVYNVHCLTTYNYTIINESTVTNASAAVLTDTSFSDFLSNDLGISDASNITSQLTISSGNDNGLLYSGNVTIPDENLSTINITQQNNLISIIKSSYASELGINVNLINVILSSGSIIATVDIYNATEDAAKVINNLYIDEIRIVTDTGSRFSSANNILSSITSGTLPTNTVTDTGLKWVVQITNGSGSSIANTNTIKLTIETITTNGDKYEQSFTYTVNSAISDNGSIYFGWSSQGATIVSSNIAYSSSINISDPTTQSLYLADQAVSGSQIVGTRFRLFYNNNEVDTIGSDYVSSTWRTNANQTNVPSIPFSVQGASTADGLSGTGAVSTGSYTRKIEANLTQNIPTLTDNTGDWGVSVVSHLDASAAGDPHITTLKGECYKFVHIGPFRLLEDVIDGKPLIINGCSENGPARWSMNEYIKKFYIQYGHQSILIDNGFRGQEVTVLEDNGFEYTEEKIQFHKTAKRYSGGLNGVKPYTTTDPNEPETEDLPAYKRNQIAVQIKNNEGIVIMNITFQNVNEFNLQPCRLGIQLGEVPLSDDAKGCIVSKKFVPVCKFDDIKSTEPLHELEEKHVELIPEDEVDPCKRNTRWR